MKLDLSDIKVVDDHCHPFIPERETEAFEQYWTLAMDPVPATDMRATVLYRMVMGRLRKVLGMPRGASDEEVLARRVSVYEADRRAYLRLLFDEAGIDSLLVDVGFPCEEFSGYSVDLDEFTSLVPVRDVRAIARIEPIIFRLFGEGLSFAELVDRFRAELESEIEERSAVAVKSVIAYLTGVGVDLVDAAAAGKAYDSLQADPADRGAEKAVRDHLFLAALDIAIDRDLPMQIHTGVGDSPIIDVRLSDPLLLYPLLAHDHYGRATYVFVHAGYPKVAAVGFLANTYPNAWIDLSEMVPFAGSGIRSRLHEILEMAPLTKVMYGSDGYNIPELFWFAALHFKDCLGEVLGSLVADGYVDMAFAEQAAHGILAENARRLYKLNRPA